MSPNAITRLNAALKSRYRIEHELGEGGMATVYLADDLKHERKVALKVLKPELAAVVGADRFLAEIKTTANLQHPHILPLFDSGEADGFLFYVMPYVEGETLRGRLDREKQLPIDEAVRIATDVAEALDAAHDQGVVHRDIKPANVLLSKGRPLVADFGIAIAVSAAGRGRLTETGLSLGTPHYMSPEQAVGDESIDRRTDVYALGCVLYEMLTGEPPHTGSTPQAILGRILQGQPRSVSAERPAVPTNVDGTVRKALEKIPADRFPSAAALAGALHDVGFRYDAGQQQGMPTAGPPPGATEPTGWSRTTTVFATATAVFATVAAAGWLRPSPPPLLSPATRAVVDLGGVALLADERIEISPDGSRFAAVGTLDGRTGLYVRNAEEERFRLLVADGEPRLPSFDPGGDWLVYRNAADHSIMKVEYAGGAPRTVLPGGGTFFARPHWGDDGTIVGEDRGGTVHRVPDTGGTPEAVTGVGFRNPRLLPDGRGVLLTGTEAGPSIHFLDLEARAVRELVEGAVDARYLPTGHLLYVDLEGTLWARAFELETGVFRGEPTPVLEDVQLVQRGSRGRFSISATGTLVSTIGGTSGFAVGNRRELLLVEMDGTERVLPLSPRPFHNVRWAPDGRRVVYSGNEPGRTMLGRMIYVYDVQVGAAPVQLTSEGSNHDPAWSEDGLRIAFASAREGTTDRDLFVVPAAGGTPPTQVLSTAGQAASWDWYDDDRILFSTGDGLGFGTWDLWTLDVADSSSARRYLEVPGIQTRATLSPSGDLVTYQSTEGASLAEVYVRGFPEPGPPVVVSSGGGAAPRWGPDGDRLYYWKPVPGVATPDSLFVARVQRDPTFTVLSTAFVLAGPYEAAGSWDLHPDGDRFIVSRVVASDEPAVDDGTEESRHVVVTNWFTELLAAVGEGR